MYKNNHYIYNIMGRKRIRCCNKIYTKKNNNRKRLHNRKRKSQKGGNRKINNLINRLFKNI